MTCVMRTADERRSRRICHLLCGGNRAARPFRPLLFLFSAANTSACGNEEAQTLLRALDFDSIRFIDDYCTASLWLHSALAQRILQLQATLCFFFRHSVFQIIMTPKAKKQARSLPGANRASFNYARKLCPKECIPSCARGRQFSPIALPARCTCRTDIIASLQHNMKSYAREVLNHRTSIGLCNFLYTRINRTRLGVQRATCLLQCVCTKRRSGVSASMKFYGAKQEARMRRGALCTAEKVLPRDGECRHALDNAYNGSALSS